MQQEFEEIYYILQNSWFGSVVAWAVVGSCGLDKYDHDQHNKFRCEDSLCLDLNERVPKLVPTIPCFEWESEKQQILRTPSNSGLSTTHLIYELVI